MSTVSIQKLTVDHLLQKFPVSLMEPEDLLNVYKILALVPILLQTKPVRTLKIYFFTIHCNIILPIMHQPHKWSFPLKFSYQTYVCIFAHIQAIRSANLIFLEVIMLVRSYNKKTNYEVPLYVIFFYLPLFPPS